MQNSNPNIVKITKPLMADTNTIEYINTSNLSDACLSMRLAHFIKNCYPNAYKELVYNASKNSLNDAFIDIHRTLENNEVYYAVNDNKVFLYQAIYHNQQLFTIDANVLLRKIPKQLKIGFAHLLKKMKPIFFDFVLDSAPIIDLHYNDMCEYLFYNVDDDNKFDNHDTVINNQIKTVNASAKKYKECIAQPLDLFYDYKPNKSKYEAIKFAILTALNFDYTPFYKITNHEAYEESVDFRKCYQLVFNVSGCVETECISKLLEIGTWNGVSYPALITTVDQTNTVNQQLNHNQVTQFLSELDEILGMLITIIEDI